MLVNNKVVKCKALNDVLENEFKDISIYDSKEMFSDAVDEFIQINVEMLAYEQADKNWNDKVSIYEVISNVDEFRDTVHDFVNKSWDGFNKLISVSEGILDKAARDYIDSNLESIKSVQQYAENGCDIYLTDKEALRVLTVCKNYISKLNEDGFCDQNDYFLTVIDALN